MEYDQFVKDLDTKLLQGSKHSVYDYNRGSTRLVRFQIGRYNLRLATGWSPEIGALSEPTKHLGPIADYKFVYCTIFPNDDVGKKFISIVMKSSVWEKFKADRVSYSAHLTLAELHNLYEYIIKSTKYEVLL